MRNIVSEITSELDAMREIGMRVPAGANAYVTAHAEEMQEYYDNGMQVSEIADLVRDLIA
jgi:hypothetical protein